jgi:hypothetical protein
MIKGGELLVQDTSVGNASSRERRASKSRLAACPPPRRILAASGLRQLPGVKRHRSVSGFGRRIFSTGYERHFNTHARNLLGCAGTNHHLAPASTLKLHRYFVNSKHTGWPIANPPGSDGSGEPIAVLFIRPGILKETITASDRPVQQRYDRCAVAIRGPEPGGVFSICEHPNSTRSTA